MLFAGSLISNVSGMSTNVFDIYDNGTNRWATSTRSHFAGGWSASNLSNVVDIYDLNK